MYGARSKLKRTRLQRRAPTAEVQGIEPLGPQCNPTPVLKTGEPTRRPDTSGVELTGAGGARCYCWISSNHRSRVVVAQYCPSL